MVRSEAEKPITQFILWHEKGFIIEKIKHRSIKIRLFIYMKRDNFFNPDSGWPQQFRSRSSGKPRAGRLDDSFGSEAIAARGFQMIGCTRRFNGPDVSSFVYGRPFGAH